MADITNQYIQVYLTYSELFGDKKPKQEIEALINNAPFLGLLISLSVMSFADEQEKEHIKKEFYDYLIQQAAKNGVHYDPWELLNDRCVYSSQGILATWKWLLAYGDKTKESLTRNTTHGINIIILLQAAIADYLYEENSAEDSTIIYEIFKNSKFNSRDNFFSMLVRTKNIFLDLARQKELFNPQEYVDFNTDFEMYYGYPIEDYLVAINGLMALYLKSYENGTTLTDLELVFSKTKNQKLFIEIIEPLCFSLEEGRHWALSAIQNPWDFRLFKEKPLLKLEENKILPVSMNYLLDQLYLSLYWKIRRCYPRQDLNFIRFYGRPFEIYIQNLLKDATDKAKLKYSFIKEFPYDRGQRRSPEAFLLLGDKLLVIEGKAKSVTESSAIDGDPDSIEKDFERLIVDPYIQVISRLSEIREKIRDPIDLSKIKSYYIIIVNQNDFPHLKPFEDRMFEMIDAQKQLPIKYFCHFEVEEFEQLCLLIGLTNKKPIFKILDQHIQSCPYLGFKNFLHAFHYRVKWSENMRDAARELIDYSLRKLFEPE